MNTKHVALLLAGMAFAIGLATQAKAASEFQYSIPPGWRDLRAAVASGDKNLDNIPPKLLEDAADRDFAVVAVEPQGTTNQQLGAIFNAVEAPSTGRITLHEMERYSPAIVEQFKANGFTASIWDTKVVKLNGVNVGKITFEAKDGKESRTLLQYIIPGRRSAAILTYAAPRSDFNRFLPVFEASAHATRGGHEPGSFKWTTLVDILGYCIVGAFGLYLMHKRRKASAPGKPDGGGVAPADAPAGTPPRPPQTKSSKYVWTCPACGKPVPARLEQCRCGGMRPKE
jgi:hypothetical protein